MMGRRVALLAPILTALSRDKFTALHKELSYELGEVTMQMAEIKETRLAVTDMGVSGKGADVAIPQAQCDKLNSMSRSAVQYFQHFVSMYSSDSDAGELPKVTAQQLLDVVYHASTN
jgi:KIF-1 binding protein C terminal